MSQIKSKVKDYILENLLKGGKSIEITDHTHLLENGIVDSISTLHLVVFIEKEFQVKFEPHEVKTQNLQDLEHIEKFILNKVAEK
ncbi:MAG: acyl carrier protein [Bdellovibrionota bacterium]